MHWKSGQEFVRPVYTPLSGPNVRLLEQADRVSNTTPEPGINGSPKIPHKSSVRMLIISTSCHQSVHAIAFICISCCHSNRILYSLLFVWYYTRNISYVIGAFLLFLLRSITVSVVFMHIKTLHYAINK